MKRILLLAIVISAFINSTNATNSVEQWKVKVDGAIFGTPLIHKNIIYVGTENGVLLYINAESGDILRTVKIDEPIRSTVLYFNNNLFVEAKGELYCFDAETAQQKFKIKTQRPHIDMLDPWDYFHTSPVENEGTVYFAGNDGTIYGVDPTDGKIIRKIKTPEDAPIRSALTFKNGNLYFGDNYGVVYEYNLSSNSFTMIYKTLEKKPEHAYGIITGGPFLHNDKLIFSNRNENFTLVNYSTKQVAWNRIDKSGSWWPLIPVVIDDKIIIGGSDNLILSALNINNGEIIWDYIADYNMFCQPLVLDKTIIVGTGDSYLNRKGNGSVFSINHETGKLINKFKPGGNVFASPIEYGGNVIICTSTGYVYCLPKVFFLNPKEGNISIEGNFDFTFEDASSFIISKEIQVKNDAEKAVKLNYTIRTNLPLPETFLRIDGYKDNVYANGTTNLQLQVNRRILKPGKYAGEIIFTINNEKFISKNFSIEVKGNPKTNDPDVEISGFVAKEKDLTASYQLTVNRDTKIVGLLTPVNSDSIVGFVPRATVKWGNYSIDKEIFNVSPEKITPGMYKFRLKSKEQEFSYQYQIQ